jgi:hypothetical protein
MQLRVIFQNKYPLPPEIEVLGMRHGVLLEEYIFRLKQVFGDSLFKRFDTELSALNTGIMKRAGGPVRPTPLLQNRFLRCSGDKKDLCRAPDGEELRCNVS